MSALESQIGGGHYQGLNPQPAEVIDAWGLSHAEGEAIYHIIRWRHKNGLEDLKKAIHWLQIKVELEEKRKARERESLMQSGARFRDTPSAPIPHTPQKE